MTTPRAASPRSALRVRIASHPVVLWVAFIAAHFVLGMLNLYGDGYPLGDVTSVYRYWSDQAIVADFWVGIDGPFVYPILAIVPMLGAQALYPLAAALPATASLTVDAGLYASTWLTLVMILDLVAFGFLTGWGRRRDRVAVAWWWIAFLLALGPIALGRIDSVTVPIAVVGVLFISTRPRVAAVLLTIGAWVKVWPGALVIAIVVASRERWRVLATAVGVSAVIAALALSFGSGINVLSFVTEQTGRGLQIEAPVTTAWMWMTWAGVPGTSVYYDQDILTWQVTGPGVAAASALMTPLLLLVVGGVALIGIVAVRRGAVASAILPPLMLAILAGMIAFQKVGSPQFVSWLAVPVILGIVTHRAGAGPAFRTPAALVLIAAVLTHVIYPYLYGYVISVYPAMLVVLTVRNLLLFMILGCAVALVRSSARWRPDPLVPIEADLPQALSPASAPRDRLDERSAP